MLKTKNSVSDIVFIGQSPIDIIADIEEEFLITYSFKKSCSNDIRREQLGHIKSILKNYSIHPGGAAANSAACYGALGGKAFFNSKISDDDMGMIFYHSFAPYNVIIPNKPIFHEHGSDLIYVLVTPDKERTFAAYYGINHQVSPDDLDKKSVETATMTYLESYLMRAKGGAKTLKEMGLIAKNSGKKVILSPSDVKIIDDHYDSIIDILKITDILIANADEVRSLFKTDSLEDIALMLRDKIDCLVITDSEKGVYISDRAGIISVPAQHIDAHHIVNTNGAGDHFAAGFLYGYGQNMPHDASGALGNKYAAKALIQESARPTQLYYNL